MSDKRTVSTDALETLGTIIDANQTRDAIHLAVIPSVAASPLKVGQHAQLIDGKAHPAHAYKGTGIVDPFLRAPVKEGESFWLVIYPRIITSLRHVWTHPDLPDEVRAAGGGIEREAAIKWLSEYAARMDATYDELIYALENYGTFNGQPDYYSHNPQDCRLYFEIATGRPWKIGEQDYFSCSC